MSVPTSTKEIARRRMVFYESMKIVDILLFLEYRKKFRDFLLSQKTDNFAEFPQEEYLNQNFPNLLSCIKEGKFLPPLSAAEIEKLTLYKKKAQEYDDKITPSSAPGLHTDFRALDAILTPPSLLFSQWESIEDLIIKPLDKASKLVDKKFTPGAKWKIQESKKTQEDHPVSNNTKPNPSKP